LIWRGSGMTVWSAAGGAEELDVCGTMTSGLATDFLQGGGEMGERVRAFDWSGHALGAPAGWPQALRTVVRLMLTTEHPALIFWGPELHCLYNDGFAQSLGPERHPAALGAPARVAWAEAWPLIGPDVEQVVTGAGSVFREDRLVPTRRHGVLEDAYWTYSYSPIDHDGGIGGVLVLCTETTGRVLETRRREDERERQQRLFEQAPGFIIIMRGPDHLVEFVNDAHRALFGSEDWVGKTIRRAFPSIEGQGFFEELDRVYATGHTFEADGVPVRYRRGDDQSEQVRNLTFIYAPLFDGEGKITGIFCEGFDVSEGKQAETRHAVLAELADRFREIEEPEAIAYAAAETLAKALGVSRAGYGTIDTANETITIERDWNAPGIASLAGVLHFRDYGSYIDDLKAGRTVVVENAELDPRTAANAESLKAISAHSFVNMPVTEQGGFVALLFLNHADPRPWREEELHLIDDVAQRTRTAVARREAEEAVRKNEARLRFLDALGTATATATDADTVLAITTRMMGEHLHLSDCAYADMDADEDMFNIRGDWHAAHAQSIVGRYSLATFGSLAVSNLRAGKPLIVNDNIKELGEDGAQAFLDIGIRATICMPFLKEGRLTALMAIHDSRPRNWSQEELGLLKEITERSWAHIERVRSEAALRESESRLRLAIEGARIGTWDWDLKTLRGRWSERTAEIMGVESAEDVTPEQRYRSIHPDDREWVGREIARSINEGSEFSTEYRVVRPDGEIRWVSSRGVVQKDEDGRAIRTTGTVRDVTERRRAQEELRALNETLEQQVADRTAERDRMWRLSEDLFLVVGKRWDIRAVNPALATLLGYAPEEVLGRRFRSFAHPDDMAAITHGLRAAARGPLRDFVARLRARDGSWRRFSWSAAPGDGEAYVVGRDITEESERREALEHAQEALRQAQKMESLGQLTGGVAHDFNNLLTPIIGSLDLLRRSQAAGEREQRLIGAALESAERARTLVQRLLAFARRQPLQPGPVDIAALVEGMSDLIASTSGPQIRLAVDIASDLPPALADANQLELAILNLSVNARDAMPQGGRLSLTARPEAVREGHRSGLPAGSYVQLSVSDTGTGMDAETMARAIEPFFSTKGIGKGTGLGLSMVHGLASQLGGAMLLSSRVGLGTTVDLLLRVATTHPAADAERAAPRIELATGSVLLVDDEPAVRAATGELLRDLGYRVTEVTSASEALDHLREHAVDFLVTDHLMPGMSGTDLARAVRERHPRVRILVVSGYAELEAISPDLPRLAKPFRQEELATRLLELAPR
jgi:PAS domain S-box-containing protein